VVDHFVPHTGGMSETSQPRIRALMTNDHVDLIHNDLASAALYLKGRVEDALAHGGRRDGVFLDLMAALTMTAFTFEAYLNFLGWKAVPSWAERARTTQKMKLLRKTLGISTDYNNRPYSTIRTLIKIRNMLAHGQPFLPEQRQWEDVGTDSELKRKLRNYKPAYERLITPDFLSEAHADVEAIWIEMLAAANIETHETWSGGSQGFELLGYEDAKGS
jgi:hypothetical protein